MGSQGSGVALTAYLHHSHHVGFERLARLAREMFGLTISEGAIANGSHRLETPLEAGRDAIREKLRSAAVVWSDETTTRTDSRLHLPRRTPPGWTGWRCATAS